MCTNVEKQWIVSYAAHVVNVEDMQIVLHVIDL